MTRVGHQPLSEVMALTESDASRYIEALSRLVARETPEDG